MHSKLLLLSLVFIGTIGCGSGNPRTVPIAGKITFAGKAPPAATKLTFVCLQPESGSVQYSGSADVNPDGSFSVTTFKPGDGLVPGKYQVNIECWQQPPSMAAPGVSHVANNFSPPPIVVSSKSSKEEVKIEVP
jgi:hypothetical protein